MMKTKRPTEKALDQIHSLSQEMERLIANGDWTQAEFNRLRHEAHAIVPDFADVHSFLIRAAHPDWLGPAYRARQDPDD